MSVLITFLSFALKATNLDCTAAHRPISQFALTLFLKTPLSDAFFREKLLMNTFLSTADNLRTSNYYHHAALCKMSRSYSNFIIVLFYSETFTEPMCRKPQLRGAKKKYPLTFPLLYSTDIFAVKFLTLF